ncbi:MAG: cell envelope integrity protein CreD [Chloroherpetonaceae bacterium]|nr:cell envelope integrity protein CreD [Chloroherpetonaceae bacterium]MCS7210105.1 cell envelope integrity protein CreD [Chloroherpetonaceae bacterium]MDW8020573.1 cell envelope integrity protein CreD [Chloroherpetonaceae bacterium]MDW8467408.1 cell envelope integrity protein CreD [Chloroherpetonaceae bacterium]
MRHAPRLLTYSTLRFASNYKLNIFQMSFSLRASVGLRITVVAILTLILLIPTAMIEGLIREREDRRNNAVAEVSEKWGGLQIIAGAVLIVPYKLVQLEQQTDDKGKTLTRKLGETVQYLHLLPQTLELSADLRPEIRHRGIYDIPLYSATVKLSGTFSLLELQSLSLEQPEHILWHEATLAIGISDLRGIREAIPIVWDDKTQYANPGLLSREVIGNIPPSLSKPPMRSVIDAEYGSDSPSTLSSSLSGGVSIKLSDPTLKDSSSALHTFSATLHLNGSEAFMVVPVGKETTVKISSSWTNPSAIGAYLPEQPLNATSSGFSGSWKVLHLNRNYPQAWIGNAYRIYHSAFGVRLLLPIDEYQKNMRTVKYAIMFIGLTFLAFIMTELLNRIAIHPIQYLLIGLALVIFYVLLLSFSEQIGFNWAYLVSSFAVIGLITGYAKSVLKSGVAALFIAGVLAILYGFLFTILQLQDYALLLGSLLLFVTLALVMYLTRKIDWFTAGKELDERAKESVSPNPRSE